MNPIIINDLKSYFVPTERLLTQGMSTIAEYSIKPDTDTDTEGDIAIFLARLPKQFIIKRIVSTDGQAEAGAEEIQAMQLLQTAGFTHSAKLYGVLSCAGDTCLVMESLPGKELYQLLTEDSLGLTLTQRYLIASQLASIIRELHLFGIVHRDIKLENVLVSVLNEADTPVKVWLIDYGFAYKRGQTNGPDLAGTQGYVDPWLSVYFRTGCPTMANLVQADWWSFGQIMVSLLTNVQLYNYDTKTYLVATRTTLSLVPPSLRFVLRQLTSPEVSPFLRPTSDLIIQRLEDALMCVRGNEES